MQHVTNIEAATESRAHFFMDRAPLAKAVAFMAKHIVERRNSIPILSNILIEAGPDCVTLMTNNLDLQAEPIAP